ncbi:glutamate racemase [Kerstersia gyiorum]|uniref:Glutamate racemase n=1 Tax=Kerstersia gyiorum TaxID=206506 RepID=A0A4Q7MWQ0_9BURK|nr:aspartate/glutamate racemase family protein [Kerstersia gyiorum]KAB0544737.1 Asp/Glu racemase [Kerstersia gyiorum]RZS73223.1 glutamate racemase [Kerstersia gyiorum]
MSIAPSASALHRPIGIFDAGIGSYAIVELVQRHYPRQDIIYFADRASFPYGSRTPGELAASVGAAIERLAGLGAQAVVLASNAPSVMVLDTIRAAMPVPVLGIYPPIADALAQSRSGHIAVLGVQSLIGSPEIRTYISREAQSVLQASAAPASPPATATATGSAAPAGRPADSIGPVTLVNASSLVAHVEDGRFLSAPEATQLAVTDFMRQLRQDLPLLDTCTLSSTHLPWLRHYFEAAAPDMLFLDPAQALLPLLQPHVSTGSGKVLCLASATPAYPLDGLRQMLRLLGVDIEPFAV